MPNSVDFSPVSAATALAPVSTSTSTTSQDPSAPPPVPVQQPHQPEPIALDVARGDDGVFVYTLTDPSTGRLVAVIPDTKAARTAGNYASGGWVSLSA